jgi:23S rRNA pseudouridine1911/1915/1917 synthase
MPDKVSFTAAVTSATRLDRVLRDQFPEWGRKEVQRAIGSGKVRLNGRVVKLSSWEVRARDRLEIVDPPAPKTVAACKFDDSWIIAEDGELIALNKPPGLLSEATNFSPAANLLDLAKQRFGDLTLVHRLDRDTSGVILLARPGPINKYLSAVFQGRAVEKQYLAVVRTPNKLVREGIICARIGPHSERRDQMMVVERGPSARTSYAILEERDGRQLVRLRPETGRTHQLRVHLAHLAAPIIGDRLYGPQPPQHPRLLLHAEQITLPERMGYPARSFTAPRTVGFW